MDSGRLGRVLVWAVVALLIVAAGAGGWWAARATLTPQGPTDPALNAPEPVWAEATEASVGRSLSMATTLRQPAVPVANNVLSGVVRSVSPGERTVGDVVYVVGPTSVRLAEADEPFWRELARDHKGADVAALQEMLDRLGYFRGRATGLFGPLTETAVKRWQKAEGRPETGIVVLGELIAVPRLPAAVSLGEDIRVGNEVTGVEMAVLAPTGQREFVMVISEDQARAIPADAIVEVTYESETWTAIISGIRETEGSVEIDLTGADGGEVCGDSCEVLPTDETVTLRSQVIVVPHVEGVGVPAAAVQSRADGTTFVTTPSGEADVTVRGSGQGLAIVEGIETGTPGQVLVAATAPEPTPDPSPTQE
ncbi:MAG: peptidoglycan-binding domain-containing protein [Tessaracoccus sp.]